MNIAIVGGGQRGLRLMEIIQHHNFQEIKPEIIAVADINLRSPAVMKAMEQGLFVTDNYRDFLGVGNVDLIVELTGSDEVYNDIISRKQPDVRAISSRTAQLFWETVEFRLRGETSVVFEVQADGRWHTYEVELSGHSFWQGRTSKLRFDPVGSVDVKVEIDRLELLPLAQR